MSRFILAFIAVVLSGCSEIGVMPGACHQLITEVCDECDLSDYYEDVVCECVENGEIDNASDYYDSKGDAEVACSSIRNSLKPRFESPSQKASCRKDLALIKEHGDDACDTLGYYYYSYSYYDYGY